jgi:C-terminal processing protease CtpA/Prc
MVSQMSEQSRSVANDLLRLEAQLSMVGKSRREGGGGGGSVSGGSVKSNRSAVSKQRDDCGVTVTSRDYSVGSRNGVHHSSRKHISGAARKAAVRSLRSKVTVVAPPGKLGIILANRTDSRGTVVSGVRTASVLATQISPGDRIIAIDDEDVSQMNVKEITTIMARKSEFERVLTLLAAPKMQYD